MLLSNKMIWFLLITSKTHEIFYFLRVNLEIWIFFFLIVWKVTSHWRASDFNSEHQLAWTMDMIYISRYNIWSTVVFKNNFFCSSRVSSSSPTVKIIVIISQLSQYLVQHSQTFEQDIREIDISINSQNLHCNSWLLGFFVYQQCPTSVYLKP